MKHLCLLGASSTSGSRGSTNAELHYFASFRFNISLLVALLALPSQDLVPRASASLAWMMEHLLHLSYWVPKEIELMQYSSGLGLSSMLLVETSQNVSYHRLSSSTQLVVYTWETCVASSSIFKTSLLALGHLGYALLFSGLYFFGYIMCLINCLGTMPSCQDSITI